MAGMRGQPFTTGRGNTIFRERTQEAFVMEMKMFARFNNRFGRAFAQFGSAVRASAAVRVGQQPTARDLETLGIDVEQFRKIHD
ncbi:hypothetical protein H7Q97_09665 [Ochrobactrum sp. CM-21-5]|nr:hypothetical protein [Ochrobactrum sp. CM-21-5]MBC2885674.1 hypothetical protein [Ochrobactrum sp. CM-21-5]